MNRMESTKEWCSSGVADASLGEPGAGVQYESPITPQAAYDARWQRILDCVALKRPDRMPVSLYATFWLARYGGISYKELMYDYDAIDAIIERAVLEFEPDAVSTLFAGSASGRMLEALDYKQLQWPGHGVADDMPYQYLDREYATSEEIEAFTRDPTGFFLRTYLPRISGVFEGFEEFPDFPGSFYFRTLTAVRGFGKPRMRDALRRVLDAAEVVDEFAQRSARSNARLAALGFPLIHGSSSGAPYDVLADYFRGATGMMKDLFRHKDRLHAAIDVMRENLVRVTVANARASGNPIVFLPIHWAPDAFMSEKQFREFWWPSFRQMMLQLIEADLIPMPLWESDCTKRLEIIADVPKGQCIYWFERTDIVRAFEVLGDVVALRGNLSPSMMTTGTPDEVDGAVRYLVENIWNRGGSLILETAFGIPDETPVENVRTMFAAARKYAG